ncbi:MAG TPA: tetratricopeptide repeat protein [Gemmataceae bacterium]|nr:tetratricopeptide repeat protein [Gemmataceae bacterium]
MAIETVDQESAAESGPAEAPPPRRLRNLLIFGLLASLAMFSFWGSKQIHSHLHPPDDPEEEAAKHVLPAKKPVDPTDLLARGDNALRQHRHIEARACYQELLDSGLAHSAAMRYRFGLCNEVFGKIDDAVDSYRHAIGTSSARSLTFAAHLGMARCLLRQNRGDEARLLLIPFLLDETRQKEVHEDIVTEAFYLLALSLADRSADQEEPFSFAGIPLEPLMHLEEIVDGAVDRDDVVATPKASPLRVQKGQGSDTTTVLSAEQPNRPAFELLTELATEGGLKVDWSVNAKKFVADRSLNLYLHDWDLRDVLELAADRVDLVCLIDGDTVLFTTVAESGHKERVAMQRGLLQRSLQNALRVDDTHPYTPAVLLELGNNEFAQERWTEAMTWYTKLTRDVPTSSYVSAGYYNLGCACLHLNRAEQARKAFFCAMDQTPGDDLSLRAGIRAAQLYLDDDEAENAIRHLRRVQAIAGHSPHQPLASLTLAVAHLYAGDPAAARKILTQNRIVLLQERNRAAASFLDAYAEYRLSRATKGASAGDRAINDLVEALWLNKDEINLGLQGQWLVAQAYADLGFSEQAERLLRKAQPTAHGNFRASVEVSLAELHARKGERADARKLLDKWVQPETTQRPRCRFLLARLDLEENRFRECADSCANLWKDRYSDAPALLATWGAALEGLGDLDKAAKCYAGVPPE